MLVGPAHFSSCLTHSDTLLNFPTQGHSVPSIHFTSATWIASIQEPIRLLTVKQRMSDTSP